MELQNFIKNFATQFDETDASVFVADTEFKALDEWSSLSALTIIAMIDDAYGIPIKGSDIREAETIEDLYNLVVERKG